MSISPVPTIKVNSQGGSNGYANGNGKRSDSPSLHIEWNPDGVRALDIASGKRADGATFADISRQINSKNAIVGVGHSSVFFKTIRLPKADPSDLRNLISVQLGTLFPLPADQLSFDFMQTSDQSTDGFLTLVAAIRSDDLRRIRAELTQANMTASRVLPIALAAPAVARRSGLSDAIIAEKERDGLALDVVQDGVLRSSRLAPLAADPVVEVRRTLAAARAEETTVLTVGALDLPQSTPSMESLLARLHEAPHLNFELAEDRQIALKKHVDSRMRLGYLLLLASICFIAGVWSMWSDQQASQLNSQASWNSRITRANTLEKAENSRMLTIAPVNQTLARAFNPGQRLSDIASVVTDSLPKESWLTGLNLERGLPMEVRGTAEKSDDVAHLVSTLGANPRFRDVRLVFANSGQVNKTAIVQFDISAVCVGNLPMPEPIKTKIRARVATTPASGTSTGAGQ